MDLILRPLGLVLAAGTLMSVNPAPQQQYSPELLAMLDPTAGMRSLCGGTSGSSMRTLLGASAAVVGQTDVTAPPLYDGLGKVHFAITTSNPLAQRYFDQGLSFAYGFNHAGAIAAFREAQRLDPHCAMCFWGEAFARGPNINAPMDPANNARAVGLANYIFWLARNGSPAERGARRGLAQALLIRPEGRPGQARRRLCRRDACGRQAPIPTMTTLRCSPPRPRWTPGRGTIGPPTSSPTRGSPTRSSWSRRSTPATRSIPRPRISTSI